MRFMLAVLALVALAFGVVRADDVVYLTQSNFQEFLDHNDLSMIEFFAPWCGHCKALKPQYETAATQLKGIAPLAAVDCTTEKDLCGEYGVKGFPTVKVFKKGTDPSDYKGARQAADIVAFMKRQTQPALVTISSIDALADLKSKVDDVVVIGYITDAAQINVFKATADQFKDDFSFALVSDGDLAAQLGATVPSVTLLKVKSEPDTVATTSTIEESALSKFIHDESFAAFGEIGPENFQRYVERNIPIVWFFLDYADALTGPVESIAKELAAEFKGVLSLVKLDGKKWAEHGKHFGVDANKLPGVVLEDRATGSNYLFSQSAEVSADSLRGHFNSWKSGSLKPFIRSQEAPATHATAVFTLVGSTFDSEVLQSDKDVMVEFYAPWCGHCKSLAPKYEKVAERFKDNSKVLIAAMDATENDATGVQIKGFPTLYFYPAGKKSNPIQYDGDRSEEAIEAFVRAQGTTFKNTAAAESGHSHDHGHAHEHDEL